MAGQGDQGVNRDSDSADSSFQRDALPTPHQAKSLRQSRPSSAGFSANAFKRGDGGRGRQATWAPTVADLNQWPAHFLPSGPKDIIMAESILSKLDGGVLTESDYSGTGCTEQAAAMIRQAVELQSLSPSRCFEVLWVCDSYPRCRHVLRCHAAERERVASAFSPTSVT